MVQTKTDSRQHVSRINRVFERFGCANYRHNLIYLSFMLSVFLPISVLLIIPDLAFSEQGAKQKVSAKASVNNSSFFKESDKDAPLYISSETLSLDSKKRTFTYRGGVEAKRGELIITAETMIGSYDNENRIQEITAIKNVVITRGPQMRSRSERAIYDVAQAKIVLTENPEIYHHGNALTADRIILFIDEDRAEAEGEVRAKVVKADSGVLSGDKNGKQSR